MTSQHTTTVSVHNPSATASLKLSTQGRIAPLYKKSHEFVEDSRVGDIRPNGLASLGGGQITWARRFMLVSDKATTISVTSRSGNFVVEELKPVEYADTGPGPGWDVARELPAAREGAKYELAANTRLSFRINQSDETLDDAYLNLRQVGDANVQIVQQEEREVFRLSRAVGWTPPARAAEVAPGATRPFTVNDSSRLLIETNSEQEIELGFANTNNIHSLHLSTVEKDGERIVRVVPPRAAVDDGTQWVIGGLNSGRINISKNTGAIVAQAPQ